MLKDAFVSACGPRGIDRFKHGPGNVLVVAPHPDDDVIGVGGTMAVLAQSGLNVFSLYVTDGSSAIHKNEDIPVVRRREAIAALKTVKARGGIFLDHI